MTKSELIEVLAALDCEDETDVQDEAGFTIDQLIAELQRLKEEGVSVDTKVFMDSNTFPPKCTYGIVSFLNYYDNDLHLEGAYSDYKTGKPCN